MHNITCPVVLPGSVILGDHDTCPAGQTHEETDKHIDDRSYSSDSGECLIADIVADDPGINHIVELLEDVSQ